MIYLRFGTLRKIRVGSFVDPADAVTPVGGLALGAADQVELLKANGAATTDISGNTWTDIVGCLGWYDLTLTIANTGTLGDLTVVIQDADVCLPVWVRCMVVTENVWDSMFGADVLHADITQVNGAAQVIADFRADVTLDAKELQATTNKDEILAAVVASGLPDFNVSGD